MAIGFVMTLPGLVIGLIAFAVVSRLLGRRRACAAGLDVLGTALAPGREHLTDERHRVELDREDEPGSAPARTRIDLERGTAVVRLPRA